MQMADTPLRSRLLSTMKAMATGHMPTQKVTMMDHSGNWNGASPRRYWSGWLPRDS